MTTVDDCMVLLRKMQGELEDEKKKTKALQDEKLVEAEKREELDRLKKVQLAAREMLRNNTIARELAKHKSPGNKRSTELVLRLLYSCDDILEIWEDVLPGLEVVANAANEKRDAVDATKKDDAAAVLDFVSEVGQKSITVDNADKASVALIFTIKEIFKIRKALNWEKNLTLVASTSSLGWFAAKQLEKVPVFEGSDGDKWTEDMRKAEKECRAEGFKPKERKERRLSRFSPWKDGFQPKSKPYQDQQQSGAKFKFSHNKGNVGGRSCFACGSLDHLKAACPKKG